MSNDETKTVKVDWETTITERHSAEIEIANWQHMVLNGNVTDGLADYEDMNTLESLVVEGRDASVDGVEVN